MNFQETFKATIEEAVKDIDPKEVSLFEQSWLDSVEATFKQKMKESEGAGFKFNVGFGTFEVTASVKDDNSNVAFEFSREFKATLNGEEQEMMVEDEDYINNFDSILTNVKIKTVPGLSAALLCMFGEGIAKECYERLAEDKWYIFEIPKLGQIKVGLFDGEVKHNFEADKELKQLVKNYGI